ncbi:uncharacterized protein LOC131840832 [Achroia grisella]|uniref:uncharacterized protein LOC131840832 n=1 Tax=Achroia grisella TaxID=688607 RepID=UPI0027D220C1|nr:uncharacterized protein LOC131840832 [Achroia grisella]
MEGLMKIQKSIQDKINKNYSNYKKSKSRSSYGYFAERLNILNNNWREFEENHRNILKEAVDTDKDISYFKLSLFDEVEELYVEFKCALQDSMALLKKDEPKEKEENSKDQSSNSPSGSSIAHLPRISLPIFSGKYLEWQSFHDLFVSMIDSNTSLAEVQKLHYLKAHLSGEAEQILRHIPITDANYTQCWNKLKKRYNNRRYIANSILTRLVGQRKLMTESANGIKQLLDTTNDCLSALSNIGVNTSSWDIIIIHLVSLKLDNSTRVQWEHRISDHSDILPTLEEFNKFLECRFLAMECLHNNERNDDKVERPKVFSVTAISCSFCKESHLLFQCEKFCNESYESRHEFIQKNKLCFNCFGSNHPVSRCKRRTTCRRCGRRHHSLLHPEGNSSSSSNMELNQTNESEHREQENVQREEVQESSRISTHFANGSISSPGQVMLATALVHVDTNRDCYTLRALLDQGSQASFVTERVVQLLGLRKIPFKGIVSGLGGDQFNLSIKHMVIFKIQSIYTSFSYEIQAYVLNALSSSLPAQKLNIQDWPELSGLTLADPGYGTPSKIDLLLGADVYGMILTNNIIRKGSVTAQDTQLGWILSGRVEVNHHCHHSSIVSMHSLDNSDEILRKFWELESGKEQNFMSEEDKACEEYYEKTTTRDESGRYVVRLPFRKNNPDCEQGDFKEIAKKRLLTMERKLEKDPILRKECSRVIEEYIDMNHMELITEEREKVRADAVYLPLLVVVRLDKSTTAVRLVFDASCKGNNGKSLNDDLLTGPRLQGELRHLLMKWRTYPICFVADIIKMYRQVKVHDEDTRYQRILWRHNSNEPFREYRILRVTFGVSSAPYLAVKSLQQVAKDEGKHFPLAADRVLQDFYMDDLMSGCQTEEEAVDIYNQMVELLDRGGFKLQKWASNSQKLMQEIQEDNKADRNLVIKTDDLVKILGVSWNVSSDEFEYVIKLHPQMQPITKRVILSDISRLFDPLGWIAPVIIQAKIYIQKLWLAGLGWDEEVPSDLLDKWISFREELPKLNQVKLPRWMHATYDTTDIEIHGYCDASNDAYGAVVYSRIKDKFGEVHVNLIGARTKVAPIKQISIPRLELCGAVLLAKLLSEVSSVMNVSKVQLRAWTDSTIVLAWLKGEPNRWKTFVANRVTEILEVLDSSQWSHIESNQNPADCASRGLRPGELIEHGLWWHGPQMLHESYYEFPLIENLSTDLEKKAIKSYLAVSDRSNDELPVWTKYSSLNKLIRVIAFCLRIVNKLKHRKLLPSYLTAAELNYSLNICLKHCQSSSFPIEIEQLMKCRSIPKGSKILSLCPFLDDKHIMRVRGRIEHSQEDYDAKHPIILPRDHHISKLIVADAHEKTLHGGPQLMHNYISTRYWIINVRSIIRQYIKKCITCIRYSTSCQQPFMGDLPSSRVTASRPFSRSGVDYCGPINVRISKGRGCRCFKGYVCLFVCMVTRAIHLEVVSDMTSEGFIAAFKRFVARRGHCQEIWSDNGTNFVGASKELRVLFKAEKSSILDEVAQCLANTGTEWHFIPPRAPNFGGIWEAGVKSTKYHLKRVLDGTTLTYEELSTLLAQVEACLNSRPMYRLPTSQEDSLPLTPGHFLIGEPLVTVPENNYMNHNSSMLRRWQLMQKLTQNFWRKWSREYLTTLCNRYKWTKVTPEPQIGQVVLIKEGDLPPSRWLFGRIEKKHPGPDNITRVVTLRCKENCIKRPVSKLCILPVVQ